MNHALTIVFARECIQLPCCIEVLGEMRGLKLRICRRAHVVLGKLTIGTHGAAQQSATERAVCERGKTAPKSVRQNIAFDFALEEIVGRLNCVKWRDSFETRHLFGRIVAYANCPNLAFFVELTKSGGCLLNGDERIRPVHLIDVDVIRPKTTQRILELLKNTLARRVAFDFAIRPVDANLGGKDNAPPATVLVQGFAHDLFGTPVAVNGRCVDQVDALAERGMNGADRFLLVSSTPHPAADGPSAECDSGTNKICTADLNVFHHGCCPFSFLIRDRYISSQATVGWRRCRRTDK